jgi:hypothetical protein
LKKILNVGGNNKHIALPVQYTGWEHILLDIDPKGQPDIICDARQLQTLHEKEYDAVYCSHNLEHYYRHDVPKVLTGFSHLLVDGGFVDIRVPDLDSLMKRLINENIDIDDFLYQSPAGPITARDVIYGYGVEIANSGNDYYAHKTGFTPKSLRRILIQYGFSNVYIFIGDLEIRAIGLKDKPSDYVKKMFKIP